MRKGNHLKENTFTNGILELTIQFCSGTIMYNTNGCTIYLSRLFWKLTKNMWTGDQIVWVKFGWYCTVK